MSITINDELRAYIDPLTADEYAALERSILTEGCRDALVLWGDVLVDGHNRHAICQKHGIEFQTVQNTRFSSMDDVHLWMIDNHLGRRSVSDFQRGVLALRKKDIVMGRTKPSEAPATIGDAAPQSEVAAAPAGVPVAPVLNTREAIAKAARVSSNTIGQIEKIQREAAPELVEAVKAGTISINAAAAVASLPVDRQVAAVAGGKKELQQAAREVREAKAAAKPQADPDGGAEVDPADALSDDVVTLRAAVARLNGKVAELNEEAAALRRQITTLTADLEDARNGG